MTTLFNKTAEKIVRDKIASEHEKIEIKPGKCRYNYKCQMNAVHEASKKGHKKLAMVVYFHDDFPVIHFVNYKKGVFTDNTLGQWSTQYDYFFIKWIKNEEFWEINTIFDKYRNTLQNYLPFWVKWFNNESF